MSHVTDWKPAGRVGSEKNFREGFDRTFGEQDIFKNLAKEEADDQGLGADSEDH